MKKTKEVTVLMLAKNGVTSPSITYGNGGLTKEEAIIFILIRELAKREVGVLIATDELDKKMEDLNNKAMNKEDIDFEYVMKMWGDYLKKQMEDFDEKIFISVAPKGEQAQWKKNLN